MHVNKSFNKRPFPSGERENIGHQAKRCKTDFAKKSIDENNMILPSPKMQQAKSTSTRDTSLVEKLKPTNFSEYIGQREVVGPESVLQQLLKRGQIPSMILWGPSGCGKSSLFNVISALGKEIFDNKIHVIKLSATTAGVNNIREAVNKAKAESKFGRRTIVFMDQIHRFNKLQQDIFLPHVEAATFTLIGATVENPSYSLNPALLSRCRMFVLQKLTASDITEILYKAINMTEGKIQTLKTAQSILQEKSQYKFSVRKEAIEWLAEACDGDARIALNTLEVAIQKVSSRANFCKSLPNIGFSDIKESIETAHILCDKETNHVHHMYSALHKSIRAGKSSASLYWLARIMAAKEDPVDIARRLIRISSEDVGLADPDALGVAVDTMHGCQMIGMPECDVILGQCAVYLARAQKSRFVYNALEAAKRMIAEQNGPQSST